MVTSPSFVAQWLPLCHVTLYLSICEPTSIIKHYKTQAIQVCYYSVLCKIYKVTQIHLIIAYITDSKNLESDSVIQNLTRRHVMHHNKAHYPTFRRSGWNKVYIARTKCHELIQGSTQNDHAKLSRQVHSEIRLRNRDCVSQLCIVQKRKISLSTKF